MKNKSFVGIDISKNVIDVSIFREDTNIKMFPHEVFNNTRKGFGDMCPCRYRFNASVHIACSLNGLLD
jgi:transposase